MTEDLSVAATLQSVASRRPNELCLVFGDREVTWGDFDSHCRRLAAVLADRGLACRTERSELRGWESGQDHLAILLRNCPEYLESLIGALYARVAPLNVNYRYTGEELAHVLRDSQARAILVHSSFSPALAQVRQELPNLSTIFQVPDGSEHPLLPGAEWYAAAKVDAPSSDVLPEPSPDDLYILYTGGTTGSPKGVLWRNADANVACFGVRPEARRGGAKSQDATNDRVLVLPPLMHGAAQWVALRTWNRGGIVHLTSNGDRFDAREVVDLIDRHRISSISIVGDAMARPLIEEIRSSRADVSSLRSIISGGAALSSTAKSALLELLPRVRVIDALGSSEAGTQLTRVSSTEGGTGTRTSPVSDPLNLVVSADKTTFVPRGSREIGWLARTGPVALGYLGDSGGSLTTYPTVDGKRVAIPGDRARWHENGSIEVLGRDASTINSGGEKIFAEEVEDALKRHPSIQDCLVVGRPSERWGQEVVGIAAVRGIENGEDLVSDILQSVRQHLAGYKVPKELLLVAAVRRSDTGKPDYNWARTLAAGASQIPAESARGD